MIKRIQECKRKLYSAWKVGEISDSRLHPWNAFLDSIGQQVEMNNKTLSSKQVAHLARIESACSDETINTALEWNSNYGSDLREIAVICAEYYLNHPDMTQRYWTHIAKKVMKDPKGHTLNKFQFSRMCMNKYADKVIQEYKSAPKFQPGQMVQVRTTNRLDMAPEYGSSRKKITNLRYKLHRRAVRGERVLAMVISSNARPMYRATKGGKVYSILPVGSEIKVPIYACEKDLKNMKAAKK